MNPHVLFNALNTVASLVRSDPPAAERVVENLSDVLRQTLRRSVGSIGTVARRDRVRPRLPDARAGTLGSPAARRVGRRRCRRSSRSLPPLVLQPLVENALAHGIGSRLTGGTIRDHRSRRRFPDDSRQRRWSGVSAAWKDGTGLGNLRERLQAILRRTRHARRRERCRRRASHGHAAIRGRCHTNGTT